MRVGALLAMMAILVLSNPAPNGVFAHPHPHDPEQTHIGVAADTDDRIHIHYAENGTGEVRDFDSTDPEEDAIEWNVRGVDAADFEISSTGVLTFMASPDFENPTDRARIAVDMNGDSNSNDPGEAAIDAIDNNYQITVSATEMSAALPAKRTDLHLTVIVGNVDDPGELTLQWLQPEVTVAIGTTLTDPDGDTSNPTWTWYISKANRPVIGESSHWNVITGETNEAYTPGAASEGRYLWVHVEYTDPQSATTKEADAKSTNPVRAMVSPGANASPDFQDDTDTRSVLESTAVGEPVGDPVTATDTDNDTLTYELDDDAVSTNELDPASDGSDLQFFDIDMETGQIEVAQELDYDAVGEGRADDAVAGTYTVIVRATDPSGLADNITVTITAENANEAPVVTGRAELKVAEGITGTAYVGLPDAPGIDVSPNPTNQQNEYVYEDPDRLDSIARWTLEGDDAGAFDHSGRFEPRYLQFKVAPDYENPTDMNRDNVYEVTLVATDTDPLRTGAGIGKVNVRLTVTNVDEVGMVVFAEGETAFLDEMLVAEVQDPDDKGGDLGEPHQGVHIVSWQWSRSLTEASPGDFEDIDGATTNRYTSIDGDRGYFLRVTATYTDPHSAADNPETPADERIETPSLRTVRAITEFAVRVADDPGSVPTFAEAEDGPVTRSVAEDAVVGDDVGEPVKVSGDVTYTLGGPDAEHFDIISDSGQIKVGADTSFDYDDPEISNTYRVTVKVEVTGGDANQKAEVDVVIMVTDVNELPVITDEDVDAAPMTEIMYPEIDEDDAPNTAAVATYVGTDPEGTTISWDLRGADASFFTINGGVLQFVNSPDFEDPKDRSGDNTATPLAEGTPDETSDNTYSVVIRAIASRASDDTGPAEAVDTLVNVTVTNVDEDGEVVISSLQPEIMIPIMASLTDPDGVVDVDDWQWEVSKVAANVLDIDEDDHWGDAPGTATGESYTPGDTATVGRYLRVTASYRDGESEVGDGQKMARMISANPVQAEGLGATNQSPDFVGEKVERSVAETTEVGDDVPGPVVAKVRAPSSTDILTYGLRTFVTDDAGTTGLTARNQIEAEADLAAFDINKATGQITVAQELDFESRGDPDDGIYIVVATVTDPSGLGDHIVVVITARDINEDPVLSGRPELTINEIDSGEANADSPVFDDPESVGDVNVYNVVDEDRRAATHEWSLEGEDKDQFQLIGNVGRTLVFRNQPDYETPADANGDNVYKVTVVTLDGHGGRGEFDVCIAVMNINEEGKITLRDEDGKELVQPYAHGPITADLTDPDGDVSVSSWQWVRSEDDPPQSPDPSVIADATSATYTPTNDDTSYFVRVTAMYTDGAEDITAGPRTAVVTAMHAVLEVKDEQRPPEFPEETAMRMVAENAPSTTFVGDHLPLPMDPDDPTGMGLKYTLEGEDTAFFELLSTKSGLDGTAYTEDDVYSTQIRVKLHDMAHDLNHEAEGRNGVYEVVLKVTDGSGLEDTITVAITVTDRNEAPSTPMEGTGEAPTPANNAPEFAAATDTREVAENTAAGENIGAPVTATDTDTGDTLEYTLGGADMASFAIDPATGQLMTKAALDFEMPADADTDNAYEVTVTASDGNTADDAMVAVTITVTDVGLEDSYDANDDGMIDVDEVFKAVDDYFDDLIDADRVFVTVDHYFDS